MPGNTETAEQTKSKTIPVVNHVITDDEMGVKEGVKVKPIEIKKTLKLLTDPHSEGLVDRHLSALKKIIKHYKNGFLMQDVVSIFNILNVCTEKTLTEQTYMPYITDVIKICRLPFLMQQTSDELAFQQIIVEAVAQLGYLMRIDSKDVRLVICEALNILYTQEPPFTKFQDFKPASLSYNREAIEKSSVAETVVKSLALVENDFDVKLQVLLLIQTLSAESAVNCQHMLEADAAFTICSRLNDPDPTGRFLFTSCEVLWNLLEHGSADTIATQLSNLSCLNPLKEVFKRLMLQSYSHYDRQLRNDLLVLANLVASKCPTAPFVETGFLKQLILFTTFQETRSHNALVKHLKLSTNHEDFELKKLLMNILLVLSSQSAGLSLISEGSVLLSLYTYVRSNETDVSSRDWSIAQFEELQLQAMACLSTLAPLCIQEHMTCQGSTRILLLIEWCMEDDGFKGHGNSFYGEGGRGSKLAQLCHAIRLMRALISTGEEIIIHDFCDQGAVHTLLDCLDKFCTSCSEHSSVSVDIECDVLFIISALCDGDTHRKELFGGQGVVVLEKYLRSSSNTYNFGLGYNKMMLAVVDSIWCSVIGSYQTENTFLEKEGAFLLLDLFEKCPRTMFNIILGCLLDLMENPKTIPHVLTWSSTTHQSAPSLLISCWRLEESDMGVQRDLEGVIADSAHPLTGAVQMEAEVLSLPARCPTQAIVDISENMRAKIYAFFSRIGFSDIPGLSTEDYITLTIIEKFLDFKLGEVWLEIMSELKAEGIEPVSPDRQALEAMSRVIIERAQSVQLIQKELLTNQHQQDLLDEQEMYAEIRKNHQQPEKLAKDFGEFVARTSNYGVLKQAKIRQQQSIDVSRVQNGVYRKMKTFHKTELPGLQTTCFSGRHVTVENTALLRFPTSASNTLTRSSHQEKREPVHAVIVT